MYGDARAYSVHLPTWGPHPKSTTITRAEEELPDFTLFVIQPHFLGLSPEKTGTPEAVQH